MNAPSGPYGKTPGNSALPPVSVTTISAFCPTVAENVYESRSPRSMVSLMIPSPRVSAMHPPV